MNELDEANKNPEFREYMSKEEDDMSISEISKIVNLKEEEIIKIRDTK